MAKIIKIKGYKRKIKGRTYKVKPHKKKVRKLGKKIKYTPIGTFEVAHDELGNFRGSRVKKNTKKSRRMRNQIDTDYFTGKITKNQWKKMRG